MNCRVACLVMLLGNCAASAAAQQQAPPTKGGGPQKLISEQQPVMKAGRAVYRDECSACHAETGAGLPGLFPPLKANPIVKAPDASAPIRLVLEGGKSAASGHVPNGTAMPDFGWKLSDEEVAAVLTYVRNSWGNAGAAVSTKAVHNVRQKDCTKLEARLHLHQTFAYFCKR